jgi:glycosyltransferase involved in cell wall biosynthesis
MKERKKNEFCWVFFAASAKPTSLRRALAERIGQNEKVVVVDLGVSVRQERSIPPLRARALLLKGNNNIIQYRPLHFPEKLPGMGRIFKALNEKLIQREIDKLLPHQMDRIVCYDSPTQYPLVMKFQERLSVYLAVDDRTLTVWGNSIPGELEAEKKLLGKVDRVVCVSEPLAQTLKSRAPEGSTPPIFVLPNGYDERIFDSSVDYPEPGFLKEVPRPRILIAGHVSERVDWNGVAAASRLRPDWTWIFLGPADQEMEEKIQSIMNSKAILHPPIPIEEVPAWISHVDACAIPYCLNRFTLASHPIKAIEYLAMGAPALSTRIPSLGGYKGGIEWVEEGDGQGYAKVLDAYVQRELQQKLKKFRRNIVKKETLENRVVQFRQLILSCMENDSSDSFPFRASIPILK